MKKEEHIPRLGLNRRRSVDEAADRLGMSIRP